MVLYVRDPVTGKFIGITTIQGESAYQIAVRNGYTGTEKDWLASLKGDLTEYLKSADASTTYIAKVTGLTDHASGLYKMTINADGLVTAVSAVAKEDITNLGIPAQDTTYSVATTTANGLMSSTDKSKLDGITESADAVSVTQSLTSGTEVGSITVNGTATKLYAPKHTQLTFTDVSASTWVSDTTYTDYPYKCVLTCSGVLATDFAEVVLGVTEAVSGNYAPICLTAADSVTIYSKVNTTITIPTINIVRI